MRYFFRIQYDGTEYGGWQRQPNRNTIAAEIEKAFATILRVPVKVVGAGRTDAGVHARAMGAHCDVMQDLDANTVTHALNALLPKDIAIYSMKPVPPSFHARFSACRREYSYTLTCSKTPLLRNYSWNMHYRVNWDAIAKNAEMILGEHDFSTFCCQDTTTENMICTVSKATISHTDSHSVFSIAANRFIYKMVRSLTGTLIDIGRGKIKESMADLIRAKKRICAGTTAPAHGLVLEMVDYPGDIL